MNTRKREISGQLRAPSRLEFDLKRVVALGSARIPLMVEKRHDGVEGIDVMFEGGRRLRVKSPWTPGLPVWRGDIDEQPVSAQLRPILNGFEISHGGAQVAARVYTAREAELDALMLERKPRRQFPLPVVPDAGAGEVHRRQGGAGGQGRAIRSAWSRR